MFENLLEKLKTDFVTIIANISIIQENNNQIKSNKKKIDPTNLINLESLKKNNIINKSYLRFKLLGNGKLTSKIDLEVDYSSISAKEKIENLGGILKIKNPK